jgi:hypothetical protein
VEGTDSAESQHAPPEPTSPPPTTTPKPRPHKLVPLAPRRYALQATLPQETHDKLRYAQKLLSHQVPSGDLARVLDHALDALIARLEKSRFGATTKPRGTKRRSSPTVDSGSTAPASRRGRYIPRAVRRAVRARDESRCTFVDAFGRRCNNQSFLEYDHVVPLARGGASSVENLRLRCHTHNQYAAERMFGVEFMSEKRRRASG